MSDTCQQCGEEFVSIANHWGHSHSKCSYPTVEDFQKEILTGILMGDGNIDMGRSRNSRFRVSMITKAYLEYIDNNFPEIGKGVSLQLTAEEVAARDRESGFNKHAKEENYNDIYKWSTITHPYFNKYNRWYFSGKKTWPDNITLTPITLKHWYVCDGSFKKDSGHRYIRFSMWQERNNTEKIDNMFADSGLPTPSTYTETVRAFDASFTVEQTQKLFDYMGDPLPGFEYKWPE